jgi:nitroimidazol reductase NimA-like FMN-containing flavoprotein (pyridoxamine 5'-phosphate oxidase superfamily)
MRHVEYVYTVGMDEADVEERLRAGEHGVLGLADDGDAYVIPLSYRYDGDHLYVRVSYDDGGSAKRRYLESTRRATFLCHEASTDESWSVVVRGRLVPVKVDETTVAEWFPPFRLFDEPVEDVRFAVYELLVESAVGRRTPGATGPPATP